MFSPLKGLLSFGRSNNGRVQGWTGIVGAGLVVRIRWIRYDSFDKLGLPATN